MKCGIVAALAIACLASQATNGFADSVYTFAFGDELSTAKTVSVQVGNSVVVPLYLVETGGSTIHDQGGLATFGVSIDQTSAVGASISFAAYERNTTFDGPFTNPDFLFTPVMVADGIAWTAPAGIGTNDDGAYWLGNLTFTAVSGSGHSTYQASVFDASAEFGFISTFDSFKSFDPTSGDPFVSTLR